MKVLKINLHIYKKSWTTSILQDTSLIDYENLGICGTADEICTNCLILKSGKHIYETDLETTAEKVTSDFSVESTVWVWYLFPCVLF